MTGFEPRESLIARQPGAGNVSGIQRRRALSAPSHTALPPRIRGGGRGGRAGHCAPCRRRAASACGDAGAAGSERLARHAGRVV